MQKLSRRRFMHLSAVVSGSIVVAACAPARPESVEQEVSTEVPVEVEQTVGTQAPPSKYSEAPMLAERVQGGQLPPVEERLPKNPVVISSREQIGKYGGEVRMIHMEPQGLTSNYGWFGERFIFYSDSDLLTLEGNLFESWQTTDDGTTWIFKLREGLKWSDGQPVTTEDVSFWWEDFATNTDLSPALPWYWKFGGAPMKVEILDTYSFQVTHAKPFGAFPVHITRWYSGTFALLPKHYMQQFHAKYRDQAELDAEVSKGGFDNWVQLFNARNLGVIMWQVADNTAEYPQLTAWILKDQPQPGLFIFERNPYYWKVDQDGNQLPYFDTLRIDLAASTEIVSMKVIQSELDYVGTHDVSVARYPMYKENETASNYKVGDYLSCMTDRYFFYPNFTHLDPVMREIINHPNFLKALNVAINRDEMNESLFYGLGSMGQATAFPGGRYYEDSFGTAWAQYDPDLGNQLLDEMGLTERDADGIRLRPDGKKLTFVIEHAGARVGVVTNDVAEMAASFWRDIGIDAQAKEEDGTLYGQRTNSSAVDCGTWHGDHCTDLLFPILGFDRLGIPTGADPAIQPLWNQYYSASIVGGQMTAGTGEEPPQYIKDYWAQYEQMQSTADEDERVRIGKQVLQSLADQPMVVGLVLDSPAPLLFNKKMQNLPRPAVPVGWDTWDISTYHPEAFFYE